MSEPVSSLKGRILSPNTKTLISLAKVSKNIPMFGKVVTEITRTKICESLFGQNTQKEET